MTEKEKDELITLLNSRNNDDFEKKSWDRLYTLLYSCLEHSANKRCQNLPLEPYDLISTFVERKLLATDIQFEHIGALFLIFENTCNDISRSYSSQKRDVKMTDSFDALLENRYDDDENNAFLDGVFLVINKQLEIQGISTGTETSDVNFIDEYSDISESASKWLLQIEKDEGDWITLYLGTHVCPENDSKALSTLANYFHIESYHHKAKKLGITGKKSGFWKGYEKTIIGQWMSQLGLAVGEDNISQETKSDFLEYLKILCQVALLRIVEPKYINLLR